MCFLLSSFYLLNVQGLRCLRSVEHDVLFRDFGAIEDRLDCSMIKNDASIGDFLNFRDFQLIYDNRLPASGQFKDQFINFRFCADVDSLRWIIEQ